MGEFRQASMWSRTLVRQSPKPEGQALSDLNMAIAVLCWAIINTSLSNLCLCMTALFFSKACVLSSTLCLLLFQFRHQNRLTYSSLLCISNPYSDPNPTLAEKTSATCWPGQQCLSSLLTRAFLQSTEPICQLLLNSVEETELPGGPSSCLWCRQ